MQEQEQQINAKTIESLKSRIEFIQNSIFNKNIIALLEKTSKVVVEAGSTVKGTMKLPPITDISADIKELFDILIIILNYLEDNFLDENGNFIKITFWDIVLNRGNKRNLLINGFTFLIKQVKEIIAAFKD